MREPLPLAIDSWQQAELNAAAWMRYWGFRDAQVTQGGSDSGIDIRSSGALGQVKFEAAQVGRPVLQRLVGAQGRNTDKALFVFSGVGFSAPAVEYANEMDICLFKYTLTGKMKAENHAARAFLRQFEAQLLAAEQQPVAVSRAAEQDEETARAALLARLSGGLRALAAEQASAAEVRKKPASRGRVRLGCGIFLLLAWVCIAVTLKSVGDRIVATIWLGLSAILIFSGIIALSDNAPEDQLSTGNGGSGEH